MPVGAPLPRVHVLQPSRVCGILKKADHVGFYTIMYQQTRLAAALIAKSCNAGCPEQRP
nr:hypothetical protein [Pelodictyon luteolum]